MKINNEILYSSCPCGSGKKFKFCCFPKVRDELPDNALMADVVESVRSLENGIREIFKEYSDETVAEAERLGDLGAEEMKNRRYDRAADLFRTAHEKVPCLFSAWNNESLCRIAMGDITAARECAERATECAPDANAFGWALRAIIAYAVHDDRGYEAALSKAMAIKPLDLHNALKVCEAIACAHRHRELLEYASASGFVSDPDVAFFAGTAAANCGEVDVARTHLHRALDGQFDERAGFLLDDLDEESRFFGLFDWIYFGDEDYPCGLLSGRIPDDSEYGRMSDAAKAYMICERVEIDLVRGECVKNDALRTISGMTHPRAERIREHLAGSEKYDKTADEELGEKLFGCPGSGGGTERRLAKIEKARVEDGADTLLSIPEDDPDYVKYLKATDIALDRDPSHPEWEQAKRDLLDCDARHPYNPRALMNYCAMLSVESRNEEAEPIIMQLYQRFPGYAFAVANMASLFVSKGDLDEAERVLDGYDVPDKISPEEFVALLKTEARIATAREMPMWALKCYGRMNAISEEFGVLT